MSDIPENNHDPDFAKDIKISEKISESAEEMVEIVVENESKERTMWKHFMCDGCSVKPIIGARYHLGNENYDLCEVCWELGVGKKPGKYKILLNVNERGKYIVVSNPDETLGEETDGKLLTSVKKEKQEKTRFEYLVIKDSNPTSEEDLKYGEILIGVGFRYVGEMKSRKSHGKGKFYYEGGCMYDGEWKNGKKHGPGIFYHFNGSIVEENWKNGERHGVFKAYNYHWKHVASPQRLTRDPPFLKHVRIYFRNERLANIDFRIMKNEEDREIALREFSLLNNSELGINVSEYKNDKHFIISLLSEFGSDFEFIGKELKKDREVILAAASNCPKIFSLVQPQPVLYDCQLPQSDRKLILDLMKSNGLCLEFCPALYSEDLEISMAATLQNGLALKFVSEELQRKNPYLIEIAVTQNPLSICESSIIDFRFSTEKSLQIVTKKFVKVKSMIKGRNHYSENLMKKHEIRIQKKNDQDQQLKRKNNKRKTNKKKNEEKEGVQNEDLNESLRIMVLEDLFEWLIITQVDHFHWMELNNDIPDFSLSKPLLDSSFREIRKKVWKSIEKNSKLDFESYASFLGGDKKELENLYKRTCDRHFSLHEIGNNQYFFGFLFDHSNLDVVPPPKTEDFFFQHGQGVLYHGQLEGIFGRRRVYRRLFTGKYVHGKRQDVGIFYEQKRQHMVLKIEFLDDEKTGRGIEYTIDKAKNNNIQRLFISFEGQFDKGVRHGLGEEYDVKTGAFHLGLWDHGIKKEDKNEEFKKVVEISHSDVNRFLNPANICGFGYEGNVFKVRKNDVLSLRYETDDEYVAVKRTKFIEGRNHGILLLRKLYLAFRLCQKLNDRKSPNIVRSIAVLRGYKYHGFVSEFCSTDILKILRKKKHHLLYSSNRTQNENNKIRILYETINGLKAMHDENIIHRDMTWEKVMLDDHLIAKLRPFSLIEKVRPVSTSNNITNYVPNYADLYDLSPKEDEAVYKLEPFQDDEVPFLFGSVGFCAPEIAKNREQGLYHKYGKEMDLYSVGIMIYCLLWDQTDPYERYLGTSKICKCGLGISEFCMTSCVDFHVCDCDLRPLIYKHEVDSKPKLIVDIMFMCWDKDPTRRPTCQEILNHQVFLEIGKRRSCDTHVTLKFPKLGQIIRDVSLRVLQPLLGIVIQNIENSYGFVRKIECLVNHKTGNVIRTDEELFQVLFNETNYQGVIDVILESTNSLLLETLNKKVMLVEEEILKKSFQKLIEEQYEDLFIQKDHTLKELKHIEIEIKNFIREKIYLPQFNQEEEDQNHRELVLVSERISVFMSHFGIKKDLKRVFSTETLFLGNLKPRSSSDEESNQSKAELPSGFGILFEKKSGALLRKDSYIPVYIGGVRDGKRHGQGTVFRNHQKIYQGSFVNNFRQGKGMTFHLIDQNTPTSPGSPNTSFEGTEKRNKPSRPSLVVHFEGEFQSGKFHGKGEEFDIETGKVTRGTWNHGLLDPSSVFRFDCPFVKYSDFKEHFNEKTLYGSGGYGNVYKVPLSLVPSIRHLILSRPQKKEKQKDNNVFVAFKVMKSESTFERMMIFAMIKRAVGLCSAMSSNSKHILQILAVFKEGNKCGYLMEFVDYSVSGLIGSSKLYGNDSHRLLDTIAKKKNVLLQTATAMQEFHKNKLMHRDLKWSNCLISKEGVVKICDFDTLKDDERQWKMESNLVAATSNVGTTGMISPEVFLGKNYSLACDVYAFSLMIYSLLWDVKQPFYTTYQCSCGVLVQNILEGRNLDFHVAKHNLRPLLTSKDVEKYPSFLIEIMIQCWDSDPFQRPSFGDIVFRFQMENNKNYSIVNLRFSKYHGQQGFIKNQKVFLLKPYKVSKIVDWIEAKFEGSKVLMLEHSIVGSFGKGDDDLLHRIIEKQQSPVLEVQLDSISERLMKDHDNVKHEGDDLKSENLELRKKNEKLLREMEIMKKEIAELRKRDRFNVTIRQRLGKENEMLRELKKRKGICKVEEEEETEGEGDE